MKYKLFLLATLLSFNVQSQTDKIFFSLTGDTVLYKYGGKVSSMYMDTIDWNIIVSSFSKNHQRLNPIDYFTIRTFKQGETPFSKINTDILAKYHLEYDGQPISITEVENICKVNKIKIIGNTSDSLIHTYKARLSVKVIYKNKTIGSLKTYIIFKGCDKKDIDLESICETYVWKKENKEKYFIRFGIKSFWCTNILFNDCNPEVKYINALY
jgi:hypothetical protein